MHFILPLFLLTGAGALAHAAPPGSVVRQDLLSVPLAPSTAVGRVELKRITLPAHGQAGAGSAASSCRWLTSR